MLQILRRNRRICKAGKPPDPGTPLGNVRWVTDDMKPHPLPREK